VTINYYIIQPDKLLTGMRLLCKLIRLLLKTVLMLNSCMVFWCNLLSENLHSFCKCSFNLCTSGVNYWIQYRDWKPKFSERYNYCPAKSAFWRGLPLSFLFWSFEYIFF